MDMNDYQHLASRTARSEKTDMELLGNFAMGMAGETAEVLDIISSHFFNGKPVDKEALQKEIGDVMWYSSQLAQLLGVAYGSILDVTPVGNKALFSPASRTRAAAALSVAAGEICDQVKKVLYHDHPVKALALVNQLKKAMGHLRAVAAEAEISLVDAAKQNIEKLEKRYPQGFSAERSLNRVN